MKHSTLTLALSIDNNILEKPRSWTAYSGVTELELFILKSLSVDPNGSWGLNPKPDTPIRPESDWLVDTKNRATEVTETP